MTLSKVLKGLLGAEDEPPEDEPTGDATESFNDASWSVATEHLDD